MHENDKRIAVIQDAVRTNFVSGAMCSNEFIVSPIILPSLADNLDEFLNS